MKYLIYAIFLLASFQSQSIVLTVGDISDTDCDFTEIQDAVESANSDIDIRVTNQKVFNSVSIIDKDVDTLTGGYDTCSAAELDQHSENYIPTEISGLDSHIALYINYDTQSSRTIDFSGFNIRDGAPSGMEVRNDNNNSSLTVNVTVTEIHDNEDYGLKVFGEGAHVDFQGLIYNNINSFIENIWGAGVNCFDGTFTMRENSAIHNNRSGIGGGIYADNCTITLYAGGNNSLDDLQSGIYDNHAFSYGGGVRFDDSFVAIIGSDEHPASISNNVSEKNGGGIYLSSGNFIQMVNVRIDGNTASDQGGGIYAANFSTDIANQSELTISQSVNSCQYTEICSSISFNKVLSSSTSHGGAAIGLYGNNTFNINQTIIQANQAYRGAVYKGRNQSNLYMEGNLIIENKKDETTDHSLSLFDTTDQTSTYIDYSTISDNNILRVSNNTDALAYTLNVNKSIIDDQNDADILFAINKTQVNIYCSILHNDNAIDNSDADTIVGNPGLIGNGNYKPLQDSTAIDPVCSNNTVPNYEDIRNQNRLTDGFADIGAYESIASDDVIFQSAFE